MISNFNAWRQEATQFLDIRSPHYVGTLEALLRITEIHIKVMSPELHEDFVELLNNTLNRMIPNALHTDDTALARVA